MIDLTKQQMHVWVHGEWDHVNGNLLNTQHKIGTAKLFENYSGDVTYTPDFMVIKEPKFWTFNIDQMEWKSMEETKRTNCTNIGQRIVQK